MLVGEKGMKKYFLALLVGLLAVTLTTAKPISTTRIVYSNQCQNIPPMQPFMLILKKDQDVFKAIKTCISAANIHGGSISGIGAIENPTLGFYNLKKKAFKRKTYSGDYEVLSLNGNISSIDDKELFVHLHTTLGKDNFSVIGGHLFDAKVAVTLELFINPLGEMPVRTMNKAIGLNLINPDFN